MSNRVRGNINTKTAKFKKVSKKLASEMLRLLCKKYPHAHCELVYKSEYQLLVSVILSAQTTDAQVNKVTPRLFKLYPTPQKLALAPPTKIAEIIRPTGYYNAKAKNIKSCAQALVERFNGQVPATLAELITLPGVGRKTANVLLGVLHGLPAWTVDTHVQRLARRLGLSNSSGPEAIEYDLQKMFAGADWSKYSITLIWHGRRTCFARMPQCSECVINQLCPSALI